MRPSPPRPRIDHLQPDRGSIHQRHGSYRVMLSSRTDGRLESGRGGTDRGPLFMSSEPGERPRPLHPGAGRRHAPAFPKGRVVDPAALETIRGLLGGRPRRRDLLIEHLHLIQDRFGAIREEHLVALAEEMSLAPVEVFEVATFYARFTILRAGKPDPPPVTVRVCDGLTCELSGAGPLREELEESIGPGVGVTRTP